MIKSIINPWIWSCPWCNWFPYKSQRMIPYYIHCIFTLFFNQWNSVYIQLKFSFSHYLHHENSACARTSFNTSQYFQAMQTDTTQHKAFPHDSVQHVHFRLYAKYEIIQTYKWNLICSSITDRDTGKFKYFKIYVYNLWFMSICQKLTRDIDCQKLIRILVI